MALNKVVGDRPFVDRYGRPPSGADSDVSRIQAHLKHAKNDDVAFVTLSMFLSVIVCEVVSILPSIICKFHTTRCIPFYHNTPRYVTDALRDQPGIDGAIITILESYCKAGKFPSTFDRGQVQQDSLAVPYVFVNGGLLR